MARKAALKGLKADPRREVSWLATMEVDACAKALGGRCQQELGIGYQELHLILAKLDAAIEAGQCDGAFPVG